MKILEVAEAAAEDVQEILAYYGSPSPASDLFARRIEDALLHLCQWPETGRQRTDLTTDQVFFWHCKPYFIVYKLRDELLSVVAILHTARNIRELLSARSGKQ